MTRGGARGGARRGGGGGGGRGGGRGGGARGRGGGVGARGVGVEVGSGTSAAPVDVVFGNVGVGGTLTATGVAGDHPGLGGSGLDPAKTVNRYWTVTNGGVGFNSYKVTLHFMAGDGDGGADPASFVVRKYDGTSWSATTTGTRTSTSVEAQGLTSFSDFAVGSVQQYTLNVA